MKTMLLALVGMTVQGATMTWQSSYTAAETTWGFGQPNDGVTGIQVKVPRFDPSLGTLTGFSVRGTVTAVADVSVTILGAAGDYSGYVGVKLRFMDPDTPFESLGFMNSATFQIANGTPFTTYSFPGALDASAVVGHGCGAFNLTFCLAALTGTGNQGYFLSIEPYRSIDGPYFTPYAATGQITADFTATYIYEPAAIHMPEPSSWALIATGLGGLAYHRRRGRG